MKNEIIIKRPRDSASLLSKYKNKKIEVFGVIAINNNYQLLKKKVLFSGDKSFCKISKKDIFRYLMQVKSDAFICFHNHPSGALAPSKYDCEATKTLKDIGNFLDIPLLDHIIISRNGYFSFLEHNLMSFEKMDNIQIAEV